MKDHESGSQRGRHMTVAAVILNTFLTWMIVRHSSHPAFFAQYIDPGSGLLLWQLVAASAAGFVFNIRGRIVELIKHIRIRKH